MMNYKERYIKARHAMQSGVAMWINYDKKSTEPKHLRVGVNSAMVDSSALANLLIAKGIISEDEYFKALAERMEAEVKSYTERIEARIGGKINLA